MFGEIKLLTRKTTQEIDVHTDARRPSNSSTSITVLPTNASVANAPASVGVGVRTTRARSFVTSTVPLEPANSSKSRIDAFR